MLIYVVICMKKIIIQQSRRDHDQAGCIAKCMHALTAQVKAQARPGQARFGQSRLGSAT